MLKGKGQGGGGGVGEKAVSTSLFNKVERMLKQMLKPFARAFTMFTKHLMIDPKVNSEFCFPETLNVALGEAEENIEGRGETKLTVSRGVSH